MEELWTDRQQDNMDRQQDNMETDLEERGQGLHVNWINIHQDKSQWQHHVNMLKNPCLPLRCRQFLD